MNRFTKEIIAGIIFYSGLQAFYRSFCAKRQQNFNVLVYHHIADDSKFPDPFLEISGATKLSIFEKQIKYVLKHHEAISLEQLVRHLEYGENLPPNSVLLTFDDGYSNVYECAFPVLKRYELPGVVFCTGDEINGIGIWCDKLLDIIVKTHVTLFRYKNKTFKLTTMRDRIHFFYSVISELNKTNLNDIQDEIHKICEALGVEYQDNSKRHLSKNQILEMQQYNFSFGAHSMTHPLLGLLKDRKSVAWEIGQSISLLEEVTNRRCISFAYPFGDEGAYSNLCIEILKEMGIKLAFTTMRGTNTTECDRYLLRRFIVQRDSRNYFRLQLSGLIHG